MTSRRTRQKREKNAETMDEKPPRDARKDRLAKQLRANLQRRKEQARERLSEGVEAESSAETKPEQESRETDT
jgi:hypothetical protein